MSFAQHQEEVDFANSYHPADRFAGFDRGDAGGIDVDQCDVGDRVIGRLASRAGQRVEIVETYCDDVSWFSVRIDGERVTELFDDRARAAVVARWWVAGRPA